MTLFDEIVAIYPELTSDDFDPFTGKILLQNDGDGDFVAKWNYSKPLPAGIEIGIPYVNA